MASLGERFKDLRTSRNWSQKKLAEVLDIEQQEVSRIETDKVKQLSTDLLHKIYVEFGDINYLFGESQSLRVSDPGPIEDPKNSFIKWMTAIERDLSSIKKQVTTLALQANK